MAAAEIMLASTRLVNAPQVCIVRQMHIRPHPAHKNQNNPFTCVEWAKTSFFPRCYTRRCSLETTEPLFCSENVKIVLSCLVLSCLIFLDSRKSLSPLITGSALFVLRGEFCIHSLEELDNEKIPNCSCCSGSCQCCYGTIVCHHVWRR